jgi:hypothetical protein
MNTPGEVWLQCQEEGCGKPLTPINRAEGDPLAAFCDSCWRQRPLFQPTCRKCEGPLVQDERDLFQFRCTTCISLPAKLLCVS